MSHFNVPIKALLPVDITPPEHIIKGGIFVDADLTEWLPVTGNSLGRATSALTTINKQDETPQELSVRASALLGLPTGQGYAIFTSAAQRDRFLDGEELTRLKTGFTLAVTAQPTIIAQRLADWLQGTPKFEPTRVKRAITTIQRLLGDPTFSTAGKHEKLLEKAARLLQRDEVVQDPTLCAPLLDVILTWCEADGSNSGGNTAKNGEHEQQQQQQQQQQQEADLLSISTATAHSSTVATPTVEDRSFVMSTTPISSGGFQALPLELSSTLAALLAGSTKADQNETLLAALRLATAIVHTEGSEVGHRFRAQLPFAALIRLVEKSDRRISLAALVLMNALVAASNFKERLACILPHIRGLPLRSAIRRLYEDTTFGSGTSSIQIGILKPGTDLAIGRPPSGVTDAAIRSELSSLIKVQLDSYAAEMDREPTRDNVDAILTSNWCRNGGGNVDEEDEEPLRLLLEHAAVGALGPRLLVAASPTFCNDLRSHGPEDWPWLRCAIALLHQLVEIFGVRGAESGETDKDTSPTNTTDPRLWLLWSCEEPLGNALQTSLMLCAETAAAMCAASTELDKVLVVVREQWRRAILEPSSIGSGISTFDELQQVWRTELSYASLQALWKRERQRSDAALLGTPLAKTVAKLVGPKLEALSRAHATALLRKPHIFKRLGGTVNQGKSQGGQGGLASWQLDGTNPLFIVTESGGNPTTTEAENSVKIPLAEIRTYAAMDERELRLAAKKSPSGSSGGTPLVAGFTLETVSTTYKLGTSDAATLRRWLDALSTLAPTLSGLHPSPDAQLMRQRIERTELRLRLRAAKDQGSEKKPLPALPRDWDWLIALRIG